MDIDFVESFLCIIKRMKNYPTSHDLCGQILHIALLRVTSFIEMGLAFKFIKENIILLPSIIFVTSKLNSLLVPQMSCHKSF